MKRRELVYEYPKKILSSRISDKFEESFHANIRTMLMDVLFQENVKISDAEKDEVTSHVLQNIKVLCDESGNLKLSC